MAQCFASTLDCVSKYCFVMNTQIHGSILNASNAEHLQDSDDDGETAAGGRLLHLLQIVNAENVMVIVTRWYGGVLLGPARFTHINNAARMLLDQEGYIQNHSSAGKKKSSR